MIKWADERFRYYVTKEGSKPIKRYGMEFAKHYLKGWGRHLLSYLIGSGILAGLIFFINDSSRTEAFSRVLLLWTLVLGIDLIITISYFIWPRKKEWRITKVYMNTSFVADRPQVQKHLSFFSNNFSLKYQFRTFAAVAPLDLGYLLIHTEIFMEQWGSITHKWDKCC